MLVTGWSSLWNMGFSMVLVNVYQRISPPAGPQVSQPGGQRCWARCRPLWRRWQRTKRRRSARTLPTGWGTTRTWEWDAGDIGEVNRKSGCLPAPMGSYIDIFTYIYIYVCIHIYIHRNIYIYTHLHLQLCIHLYTVSRSWNCRGRTLVSCSLLACLFGSGIQWMGSVRGTQEKPRLGFVLNPSQCHI